LRDFGSRKYENMGGRDKKEDGIRNINKDEEHQ